MSGAAGGGGRWRSRDTFDWLIEEGRFAPDFDGLVAGLGARLVADGAPISRLRIGFRTLHPLVTAVTSVWERSKAAVEHTEAEHGLERRATYVGSPMQQIAETKEPFRRRLDGPLGPSDHVVLHELKAAGATDYYGRRLSFASGGAGIIVLTGDAPGGFEDAEIDGFDRLAAVVSPMVEIERLNRIGAAVAEAYLGSRSGARVLGGQITRGDVEAIEAAILVADLRDWTGISERLAPRAAVDYANRYFDVVGDAVEAAGGEILKFIGDGVLAIFTEADDAAPAAERALSAGRGALAGAAGDGLSIGLGLHYGEVLYGNVGAAARLDFTVLGSAVNVAARIEALCKEFDAPLLYTADIADRLPRPGAFVADASLKGVGAPVRIFRDA